MTPPTPPHALLFDMDGLLIDSEKIYYKVSYQMAAEMQVPLTDEILSKQMARSPLESMEIFIRELNITGYTPEYLADWRDRLMVEEYKTSVNLMPGAMEILEFFHGSLPMAMATGSSKILVDIILDRLKIRKFFGGIQTSDEIEKGKPHPEIYERAAALIGADPKKCVVLEDAAMGAQAGQRAGCYVIAVPNERTKDHDFSYANAVATNLMEAQTIIKGLIDW